MEPGGPDEGRRQGVLGCGRRTRQRPVLRLQRHGGGAVIDAPEQAGDRVVGPLREARQPLYDGLKRLHTAAQAVSSAEPRVAAAAIDSAREYLDLILLPALNAEEFTLFIAVNGVFSHPEGCEVMSVQHRAIRAMASDLAKVADAARKAEDPKAYERYLLPLLYGLYALIRAHMESEDEAYLPLLDQQLSESQIGVIVTNIGRMSASSLPGAQPGRSAH